MTAESIITGARELAPDLAARAARTYADARVGEEVLVSLAAAGLLDPFRDLDPVAHAALMVEAPRALAASCASTAWLVAAASQASAAMAALGPWAATMHEAGRPLTAVWADRSDDARAVEAGDALKVSGTWRGVPGAGLAPWFVLRLAADRAVAVSALNLAVTLNDHQAGLRGAGIGEVVASSVSVPRAQVLSLTEPMQRLHALAPLGVVIGGAEGGYRDYVTSTRKRAASVGGAAVARFIQVQTRLGEAEADLNAARMTAEGCVSSLLTAPRAVLDRDAAYAARLALRAVTLLVQQMGAVGIHETNVVQRHARDLRASTADRRLAWDAAMAARGRAELGIADADRAVETVAV